MRILSCPEETLRLQCKRCPIFKKLSDEEFATFLPGVTLVEYAKQDLIMDEDADADCCFMVISGHARLFHNMPDGHERLVHIVGAPDTFGIATMFRQRTYSCSASAQGTCRILRIPRENLIALTQKSHAFALEVIVILGMRIRMLEKKLGTQGVRIVRPGSPRSSGTGLHFMASRTPSSSICPARIWRACSGRHGRLFRGISRILFPWGI